jgi:hypothetical protein
MSIRRLAKAIGIRRARKLIHEVGIVATDDLVAERDNIVGRLHNDQVVQLKDGRVLHILYGGANIYSSRDDFLAALALIREGRAKSDEMPFARNFQSGESFIDAVPVLVADLPNKLSIPVEVLNGTVDSIERLDRAVRHIGGQKCLDDPTILAPLVAYVGEVIRSATSGEWKVEVRQDGRWEPIVRAADGRRHSTFVIFKELLERGSMYAAVSYEIGRELTGSPSRRHSMSASRPALLAVPTGSLAAAPRDAYVVIQRYGDARPWSVTFTRDIDIEGFPFAMGTTGWFKRDGEIISGVLSRQCSFGTLQFPAGTLVRFYAGHVDGRVSDVKLGADQTIQGVYCKGGTNVLFTSFKRHTYLAAATLATDQEIDGVLQAADTWIALDRKGHLTDARAPHRSG